jgi:hypothetical protein
MLVVFQGMSRRDGAVVDSGIVLNHPHGLAIVGIGIIEAVTALATLLTVDEGKREPPPREGRSWLEIARSAWGRDVLEEKSYLRRRATCGCSSHACS